MNKNQSIIAQHACFCHMQIDTIGLLTHNFEEVTLKHDTIAVHNNITIIYESINLKL